MNAMITVDLQLKQIHSERENICSVVTPVVLHSLISKLWASVSPSNEMWFVFLSKLYIPSTLNIDLILWHTQLIVKSWVKSWVIYFTFQAYTLPHTYIDLYMCQPIQILYLNLKADLALPKMAGSAQTHKSISFICIIWSTLYVYL